ncbi:MAG: hypothetical protein A3F11_04540 [Gammaproteobacteria bacterium RIFCSPHIGHO2_12_FULL_37_14]|nr:MAG: hypothetical protein A3F11_04540 [Gammaproteobacteria bacterium RIFCSPHIGHO2_12_FULL_37_14]
MQSRNQELNEVRQALLGITTEITEALKNVPEQLDKLTQQIYKFNRFMLDTQMKISLMGADEQNTFIKENKKFINRAREVVERDVYNYLNANEAKKDALKETAIKNLSRLNTNEAEKESKNAVIEPDLHTRKRK